MKKKFRKLLALGCAAAMLLSFSACNSAENSEQIKNNPSAQQQNTNGNSTETPEKPPISLPEKKPAESQQPVTEVEQNETLIEIQDVLEEIQFPCAVAYLGYTEGPLGDGYHGWFEEMCLLDTFPFLTDIPVERIIEQDGGEVYCIIPRNESVAISVYAQEFDYNGNLFAGDELFSSTEASPFLVRGNISEIVPNTIVSIEYEDGSSIEFSPCLSGKDGHLSIADDQFIMDISQYSDVEDGYSADAQLQYLGEGDLEGQWVAYGQMYDEYTPLTCYLEFTEDETGASKVIYWYGYESGDIVELFEGRYYESDIPSDPPSILFEMELVGGVALEVTESYWYRGSFNIAYSVYGDIIVVSHLDGNPLVHGFEGQSIIFERTYG